jgi:hypothetical protein
MEREVKPPHANNATRLTLAFHSKLFVWRDALIIVRPDTSIRWHQKGFLLLWRWNSNHRIRPRILAEAQQVITERAENNPEQAINFETMRFGEPQICAAAGCKHGIRLANRRRGRPQRVRARRSNPGLNPHHCIFMHDVLYME